MILAIVSKLSTNINETKKLWITGIAANFIWIEGHIHIFVSKNIQSFHIFNFAQVGILVQIFKNLMFQLEMTWHLLLFH